MSVSFDVQGQVAVITGVLGQLGRQYAQTLADHGATVLGLDLPPADAPAVAAWKESLPPGRAHYAAADITDRAALERALAQMEALGTTPSILVNNAALDSPPSAPPEENGPFETYPEASLDKILDVNVKGIILPCQVFGGAMAQHGGGSIINIASIYGLLSPNQSIYEFLRQDGKTFYKPVAYAASKSAVLNITRYLATYWAQKGVRVNTLTLAGVFNNQDPRFLDGYCKLVPMGRMARADEFNGALLFLASGASSYVTGSNLVIDGGWTAW